MISVTSPTRCMQYSMDPYVFKLLPDAKIAVAVARILVEKDPKNAKEFISSQKQRCVENFSKKYENYGAWTKSEASQYWGKLFDSFNAGKDPVCTLEGLYRRVDREAQKIKMAAQEGKKRIPKPDLGKISNIVDLANCISSDTETPIGVMNYRNLTGNLTFRFGTKGETFTPLGTNESIPVADGHLVIADQKKVLSWLWTYKVAEEVCIRADQSKEPSIVLICADQAKEGVGDAEKAIALFMEALPKIGGQIELLGILDRKSPTLNFKSQILGSVEEKKTETD